MMAPKNNNPQNQQQQQQQQGCSSDTKKTEQKIVIKCPRCDSSNTKFCYYNNYSLTQPRHFCKTCRRYWTNGGSLRNVPIGGGCRKKQQKLKNSSLSSSLSRFSSSLSSSQSIINKFSSSSSSPSLDFHLGGLLPLQFPLLPFSSKIHQPNNQFSSSFQLDHSVTSNSLLGQNLSYTFPSGFINGGNENGIQGMNLMNVSSSSTNLAIESLSCMNNDLHLKIQEQRLLGNMFGGGDDNGKKVEKIEPVLFQNLEISKAEMFQAGGVSRKEGLSDQWFFGMNSYSSMTPTTTTTTTNVDLSVCINGDHENGNNNWIESGVQAWEDAQQSYSDLP